MEGQKRPVLTLKNRRKSKARENNETGMILVGKKRQYIRNEEEKREEPATEKDKRITKHKSSPEIKEECPSLKNVTQVRKSKTRRHNEYVKRKINDVFSFFPAISDAPGPLPLAINIHIQMMEYIVNNGIPVNEAQVLKAIKYYVLQKSYHLAIIKYNWRRDIHGNKTTKITRNEKDHAIKKLK